MTEPYKLIIEDDEGKRSVVPVELGEISVGRLEGNTIRLNERNVSRHHARLSQEAEKIFAEDLDSYNGVFINGERIQGRKILHEGDLLRIGDFHLELRGEGLQRRSEETTQKTTMPDLDATQPEIRVPSEALAAEGSKPKARAEPTAIIRMDHVDDVEDVRRETPGVLAGEKPRLLCVSTNFAGQQFEIGQTEVVIGRTDDNDIQIDHRSVSRNHAKLVTAGRTYKIIDLKSANGTLVNGEQYAQLALKAGDLIELGHVKFRFLPPGYTYHPTADEDAAIAGGTPGVGGATSAGGTMVVNGGLASVLRSNPLGAAAAGAMATILVVLIIWVLASGTEEDTTVQEPSLAAVTYEDDSDANDPTERLIAKAREFMQRRQWAKAIKRLNIAIERDPSRDDVIELRDQAKKEQEIEFSYEMANQAIRDEDWGMAWNSLNEIPDTSVYYRDAVSIREHVKGALVSERVGEARQAMADGQLGGVEETISEIEAIDAGASQIPELRAELTEAKVNKPESASVSRPAKPKGKTGTSKTSKTTRTTKDSTPKDSAAASASKKDPKTLYKEGISHLSGGNMPKAIDSLSKCVQVDRTFCLCYRAMGIAYARSGNGPKAARYYKLYLKHCPNAKDADQVKKLLDDYDG